MDKDSIFKDIKKIIIETDEENPTKIAILSNEPNESEPIKIFGNYRVRCSYEDKD